MSCFICDKHLGISNQPPGGYFYEDDHWKVCHFPADQSVIGRIALESKRHFLDFSEMTGEEAASYGVVVKLLYAALKQVTEAERVYQLITIDAVPHFHVHFVPRGRDSMTRGVEYLRQEVSCNEEDALQLVHKLQIIVNNSK